MNIRFGEGPYKEPKVQPPTEYARGYEKGAEARKANRYDPQQTGRFINANRNAKDSFTRGYCDGLGNVERE